MEFIYIKTNTLTDQFCSDLIQIFESASDYQYKGVTSGGLNVNIKDTMDLKFPILPDCSNNNTLINLLYQMNLTLNNILYSELKNYMIEIAKDKLKYAKFYDTGFQMQKYDKGTGKYIFHNDFGIDIENKSKRVLTYLWYINTVEEGGETLFGDDIRVKPEAGKLVIFPSCWTYPHKACVPLSSDKYIITGWFYANDDDFLTS